VRGVVRAVVVLGERGCEEGYHLRLLFVIHYHHVFIAERPCKRCASAILLWRAGGVSGVEAAFPPSVVCRVCMYEGSMEQKLAIVRHCFF